MKINKAKPRRERSYPQSFRIFNDFYYVQKCDIDKYVSYIKFSALIDDYTNLFYMYKGRNDKVTKIVYMDQSRCYVPEEDYLKLLNKYDSLSKRFQREKLKARQYVKVVSKFHTYDVLSKQDIIHFNNEQQTLEYIYEYKNGIDERF